MKIKTCTKDVPWTAWVILLLAVGTAPGFSAAAQEGRVLKGGAEVREFHEAEQAHVTVSKYSPETQAALAPALKEIDAKLAEARSAVAAYEEALRKRKRAVNTPNNPAQRKASQEARELGERAQEAIDALKRFLNDDFGEALTDQLWANREGERKHRENSERNKETSAGREPPPAKTRREPFMLGDIATDWGAWHTIIRHELEENVNNAIMEAYPGTRLHTNLDYTVTKDRRITNIKIRRSSGNPDFDRFAVEQLKSISGHDRLAFPDTPPHLESIKKNVELGYSRENKYDPAGNRDIRRER